MPKMKRMLGSRMALALGIWVAYTLAFIPLHRLVGLTVAVLGILPVIAIGWLFGMRAGLLAGLLTFPLNVLLTTLVSGTGWGMMTPAGLFGSVIILLLGGVVGRLSDLGGQLKQEIAERERAEEGLHIFEYIVESSIDAILMTDSELHVAHSNRACNHLVARNVTGQPLMSLWFGEDLPLLNDVIEWARVSGFFSAARLNGFHSVIDQYPGIEIVGTLAADWSREKGRQAAEEFLRANPPGTLDVIWAASGEMGLGAMLAVEAAGRQDEVRIFTNDVTPESADQMQRATDMETLLRITVEELNKALGGSRAYVRLGTEVEPGSISNEQSWTLG